MKLALLVASVFQPAEFEETANMAYTRADRRRDDCPVYTLQAIVMVTVTTMIATTVISCIHTLQAIVAVTIAPTVVATIVYMCIRPITVKSLKLHTRR